MTLVHETCLPAAASGGRSRVWGR